MKPVLVALALALAISAMPTAAFAIPYCPDNSPNGDGLGYLVKFKPQYVSARSQVMATGHLLQAAKRQSVGLRYLRRTATGADVIRFDASSDAVAKRHVIEDLLASGTVEYIEPNVIFHATQSVPAPADQWALLDPPGGIRAINAWWNNGYDGRGTTIAILDTGITQHPKLVQNRSGGYDFISSLASSNDGNGRDSSASDPGDYVVGGTGGVDPKSAPCPRGQQSSWHGTAVAGVAAAGISGGNGTWGVAPGAKIVPVRVLGASGGELADIVDAIVWSAKGDVAGVPSRAAPVSVINMSLNASTSCSANMQQAISFALSRGVAIVVAAGNDNTDAASTQPANCLGVISVSATTNTGEKAFFSNYGTNVAIAAPGRSIITTSNAGATGPAAHIFKSESGTSMAAPHVAGTIALLKSANSTYGPSALKRVLQCTATRAVPNCPSCGKLVDATAAMEYVRTYGCSGDPGSRQTCWGPCFPPVIGQVLPK